MKLKEILRDKPVTTKVVKPIIEQVEQLNEYGQWTKDNALRNELTRLVKEAPEAMALLHGNDDFIEILGEMVHVIGGFQEVVMGIYHDDEFKGLEKHQQDALGHYLDMNMHCLDSVLSAAKAYKKLH